MRQALGLVCERVDRESRAARVALRWPLACFDVLAREAGDPSRLLGVFRASHHEERRFYWERVSEGRAMLGLGAACCVEASGPDRFDRTASATRALFDELMVLGEAPASVGPILLGGFAFDDGTHAESEDGMWCGFEGASLVLPEILLVDRNGLNPAACTVHTIEPGCRPERLVRETEERLRQALAPALGSDRMGWERGAKTGAPPAAFHAASDRTREHFCQTIEAALSAIDAGVFDKVVLARSLELLAEGEAQFDASAVLDALRRAHPRCVAFAVERGDRIFVGATPERLVQVDGDVVRASAVAGSAPRGESPREDERRARTLRESKKEQAEHAVVVEAIEDALAPLCVETDRPASPSILALEGIQHLETPIRARLDAAAREGRTAILQLLRRLHPTPAVGGAPRDSALAWLASNEGLERGWYAGPIGYVDAYGGGEFHVALRSALLGPRRARLFAGAGIVAGSVPDAELAETRLKLRTLLTPLLEI